jgi:hypothetical protein
LPRQAAGRSEQLHSGAQLSLGDELSLQFEASTSVFVYVIDEDDQGHAYVLFPIPGLELQNPLAPRVKHWLPGFQEGKRLSWIVNTPGGREHLLVLASPERLVDFERAMSEVPFAHSGQLAVPIPEKAKAQLRGIGLVKEASGGSAPGSAGRLFEMAGVLAGGSEVAEGPWLRRIDLENPPP